MAGSWVWFDEEISSRQHCVGEGHDGEMASGTTVNRIPGQSIRNKLVWLGLILPAADPVSFPASINFGKAPASGR